MEYLGHVISTNRIEPDHSKIIVMLEWPVPNNQRDLRGFLGLTGFYRKFIKGYAAIVAPLTSLLCKNNFSWTPETQKVFEWLKVAMTNTLVLAIPNFSLPFILETDASGSAMGVVLMQDNHPIAFFSKQLSPQLQRVSTYVRELHVMTTAI